MAGRVTHCACARNLTPRGDRLSPGLKVGGCAAGVLFRWSSCEAVRPIPFRSGCLILADTADLLEL